MGIRINKLRYSHGDWNAICDVCGFQYKASELIKRWDGLMVCAADWEPRQPQDHVRIPRTEKNNLPFISPRPAYTFIDPGTVDYSAPSAPSPAGRALAVFGGKVLGVYGDKGLGVGS